MICATDTHKDFVTMTASEKLILLMKTDALQLKTASTILQMNRRRRSIIM